MYRDLLSGDLYGILLEHFCSGHLSPDLDLRQARAFPLHCGAGVRYRELTSTQPYYARNIASIPYLISYLLVDTFIWAG